jgi:ABC-type transporter Mla MlaB component
MLRITVKEGPAEQRWVLQGRLTKNSLPELISNWQTARDRPSACNRVVDLNEVTVIDKSGEKVLSMMIDEGARFVASGLYTKHLLKTLHERNEYSHNPE